MFFGRILMLDSEVFESAGLSSVGVLALPPP